MIHELKTEPRWFERVKAGEKHAEVRVHDRDYQVGDLLHLYEINKHGTRVSRFVERDAKGRFLNEYVDNDPLVVRITHVLLAAQCEGLSESYCLLSIEAVTGDE